MFRMYKLFLLGVLLIISINTSLAEEEHHQDENLNTIIVEISNSLNDENNIPTSKSAESTTSDQKLVEEQENYSKSSKILVTTSKNVNELNTKSMEHQNMVESSQLSATTIKIEESLKKENVLKQEATNAHVDAEISKKSDENNVVENEAVSDPYEKIGNLNTDYIDEESVSIKETKSYNSELLKSERNFEDDLEKNGSMVDSAENNDHMDDILLESTSTTQIVENDNLKTTTLKDSENENDGEPLINDQNGQVIENEPSGLKEDDYDAKPEVAEIKVHATTIAQTIIKKTDGLKVGHNIAASVSTILATITKTSKSAEALTTKSNINSISEDATNKIKSHIESKSPNSYELEQLRRVQSIKQRMYALIVVFAVLASVLVVSLIGIVAFIVIRRRNKKNRKNKPKTNIVKNLGAYKTVKQQDS